MSAERDSASAASEADATTATMREPVVTVEDVEGEMSNVSLDDSHDDDDHGHDAANGTSDVPEVDISSPVTETGTAASTPTAPTAPQPSAEAPSPSTSPAPAPTSPPTLASASASPRSSLSSRRQQNVSPIPIRPSSTDSRRSTSGSISKHSISSSQPRRSGAFSPVPSTPTGTNGTGTGSAASPPRLVTSPRFRSVEVPLPSLSASVASAVSEPPEPPVDEGAPFESIALDTDGPPPPPLPAQVAAEGRKRDSWTRESISKTIQTLGIGGHASGPPSAAGTSAAAAAAADGKHGASQSLSIHPPENGAAAGIRSAPLSGASTPMRHAPPAHPHPFPIPSAPTSPHVGNTSGSGYVPPTTAPVPHPHHGIGVKGVSTLDKFISRTRPQHLPPKSRDEDQEHLHEWEHMMAKSKEHEAERKKQLEQKRLEKERHIIAITPRWEALLNDPDFSVSKIKNNSIHRKLWFEGVPHRLRGQAWSQSIGNPLAMNKDAYKVYLRRAHKAYAAGRFPQSIIDQMEVDIDNTFPTLHVFHKGSPMREDLKDLISAWVVWRSDQARGYAPHIAQVAAMFLLTASPQVAFLSLVNFLSRPTLSAFYNEVPDEIDAFYRVFENLQADMFPRIFANCKNLGLRLPESYFRSALVEQVPFAVACRLWDQIMLEGDGYIFRAALAIFGFLEPRLYYPDKEEILSVLEGRNAATQAITERERERARLRGEQYEEALDGKLSVFGLAEDPLFEWLENDGWKDSRFERLVTRELPD